MAKPRNTFGVSLAEEHASRLRGEAKKLGIPPTTLAARLIEASLEGGGAAAVIGGLSLLEEQLAEQGEQLAEQGGGLEKELSRLRRDLQNGLKKILAEASDMKAEEIRAWAAKYLSKP